MQPQLSWDSGVKITGLDIQKLSLLGELASFSGCVAWEQGYG